MSMLIRLFGIFSRGAGRAIADDELHTMDHVVPAPAAGDPYAKKVKAARRRHRKPFKARQEWQRRTEASPQLQVLNEKSEQARKGRQRRGSEPARGTVTAMARRKS